MRSNVSGREASCDIHCLTVMNCFLFHHSFSCFHHHFALFHPPFLNLHPLFSQQLVFSEHSLLWSNTTQPKIKADDFNNFSLCFASMEGPVAGPETQIQAVTTAYIPAGAQWRCSRVNHTDTVCANSCGWETNILRRDCQCITRCLSFVYHVTTWAEVTAACGRSRTRASTTGENKGGGGEKGA